MVCTSSYLGVCERAMVDVAAVAGFEDTERWKSSGLICVNSEKRAYGLREKQKGTLSTFLKALQPLRRGVITQLDVGFVERQSASQSVC